MTKKTTIEIRRELSKSALPHVRALVQKFDLAAVNKAVKMIYDERVAKRKLQEAKRAVEDLERRLKQ